MYKRCYNLYEMLMFVKRCLKRNQSGLVSITVAIIMMTIITLLIVSYSLIARREQRLALDRRLSSQAYFAAETGVNKAKHMIKKGTVTNIEDCDPAQSIDLGNNIKTTCVLIDQTPDSISFDSVTANRAKVMKLSTADGSNIRKLEFYWQSKNTPGNFAARVGSFPESAEYSMLKVSLTNIPLTGFTREDINLRNTYSAYLWPKGVTLLSGANSSLSFVSTDQGAIVEGECIAAKSPKECKATINIPNTVINTNSLYLTLSSIYSDASVTIKGYNDNSSFKFKGAQAVIDSTGKSADVLRRIQARVSLSDSWEIDNFVVSSIGAICKVYKHNEQVGVKSEDTKKCPTTENFQ